MGTTTRKHSVKFVNICPSLYSPRWNVLKLNIEHNQELLDKQQAISGADRNESAISMYKRAIFHQQEELKGYNYMWDAVMSTEERKLLINSNQ